MKIDASHRDFGTRREGEGLLAGTVLAAFLALVFGACLLTILDATRPVAPTVASSLASSHAANIHPASF